ncbi:MAG: hypothetical protein F6K40_02150 [Okeania sp. SIO3I5]|uniref:hypothetical protein n=1 Tax=Okeania sp. SIO3I5 TaxID=2607805 RepID=UPI0013BD8F99|nr:hypothetical protein [Okeania sp. SIO3I5]NEQ35174.1 hypothetical protein [Okeania sp. SIO3I5]
MKFSDLTKRYQVTRSAMRRRLEAVEIDLPKDNRGWLYATPEHLKTLDDLHHHLINGGRFCDYSPAIDVERAEDEELYTEASSIQSEQYSIQVTRQSGSEKTTSPIELLEKLVGAIATNIQPVSDVVRRNTELQQAMDWVNDFLGELLTLLHESSLLKIRSAFRLPERT